MGKALKKWLRQNKIIVKKTDPNAPPSPPKPVLISHPLRSNTVIAIPVEKLTDWSLPESADQQDQRAGSWVDCVRPGRDLRREEYRRGRPERRDAWRDGARNDRSWHQNEQDNRHFGPNRQHGQYNQHKGGHVPDDPRHQQDKPGWRQNTAYDSRNSNDGQAFNNVPYGRNGSHTGPHNRSQSAPPRNDESRYHADRQANFDYCLHTDDYRDHSHLENERNNGFSNHALNNRLTHQENWSGRPPVPQNRPQKAFIDVRHQSWLQERPQMMHLSNGMPPNPHHVSNYVQQDQNSISEEPRVYQEHSQNHRDPMQAQKPRPKKPQSFDPRQAAQPMPQRTFRSKKVPPPSSAASTRPETAQGSSPPTDVAQPRSTSLEPQIQFEDAMPSEERKFDRPFTDDYVGQSSSQNTSSVLDFSAFTVKRKLEDDEDQPGSSSGGMSLKSILKRLTIGPTKSKMPKMYKKRTKIKWRQEHVVSEIREYDIPDENKFDRFHYNEAPDLLPATELPNFVKPAPQKTANNQLTQLLLYPNYDEPQPVVKRYDPKEDGIKRNAKYVNAVLFEAFNELGGKRAAKQGDVYFNTDWWITDSLMVCFDESTLPRTVMSRYEWPYTPSYIMECLQKKYKQDKAQKSQQDIIISHIYYSMGFDMIAYHKKFNGIDAVKSIKHLVDVDVHNFVEWVIDFFQTREYNPYQNDEYDFEREGYYEYIDSKFLVSMPVVVLVTIPEIGACAAMFEEFNNGLRDYAEKYQKSYEDSLAALAKYDNNIQHLKKDSEKAPRKPMVELLDWAELVIEKEATTLEDRFKILMEEAHMRFGLIRSCDRIKLRR